MTKSVIKEITFDVENNMKKIVNRCSGKVLWEDHHSVDSLSPPYKRLTGSGQM